MSSYPSTPQRTPPTRPWCCFRSGARTYAVDLKAVVEVIETEELVRLPRSPAVILGLCTFRRDVVPVVRLSDKADGEAGGHGRINVLILRTEQGLWGLRIDRSGTAVTEDVLHEEPVSTGGESLAPVLLGVLRRGETVSAVIDPEPTWQRLRAAIERDFRTSPGAPPEVSRTGTGGAG